MQIPIHFKQDGATLPKLHSGETRYVIGDNGIFLERRTPTYTTSTRIRKSNLGLDQHSEYCRLGCGKLPRIMQRVMLDFFHYAHQVHGGEAALVLLYNPHRRTFRWHCPQQTVEVFWGLDRWVTSDQIEFQNPLELPEDYMHFGDAHLHPGPPNPSYVDIADDQDGLHIIVGNINTTPSYNIDFVMDDTRFRVPDDLIFEQPGMRPGGRPPQSWLRQIHIRRSQPRWKFYDEHREPSTGPFGAHDARGWPNGEEYDG